MKFPYWEKAIASPIWKSFVAYGDTRSNPGTHQTVIDAIAEGNPESLSALLGFQPSLVRDGKQLYPFSQGDCFFVSLGMDPGAAAAFSHYPVYSNGGHGEAAIPSVEKICDKYGVNTVFNGHYRI